ncbi:sigma-54-dependent transcriptional regulator [Brevirhabdus sp.]|uniref:sigma-54-dependent transcriptional regulator n=1 Tax=Brevirhabdus sp. TaxID=2004514 RepID=UPI004059D286
MTALRRVLLVDDDKAVRDALAQTLELHDLAPMTAASFTVARDIVGRDFAGVVLTDIRMPGKDGFQLLSHCRTIDPELPVILLTGEADVPMAVRGMTAGAFDFLEKPCSPAELLEVLDRALKVRAGVLALRAERSRLQKGDAASRLIIGVSAAARTLRAQLRQLGPAGVSVLITGAPGTGTARVAEVLHLLSPRSSGPFTRVSGAGADARRLADAFQRSEGGTVFLDEVAALDRAAQFALLELLEANPRTPLLAGTYHPLQGEAEAARFNADLFYRLEVATVRIPGLAERVDDIPAMFRNFVETACEQAALPVPEIPADLIARLMEREWPGNARALQNVAMRFALGVPEAVSEESIGLAERMRRVERTLIAEALKKHRGNASETARALELPRKTFYDKLSRHGLRPEDFR